MPPTLSLTSHWRQTSSWRHAANGRTRNRGPTHSKNVPWAFVFAGRGKRRTAQRPRPLPGPQCPRTSLHGRPE
eukprot:37046-Lingulodinium_polyedra.AAC.1